MISEQIELLGKGLYEDIPDVLTLKSIPTSAELDYIGSEDFQATMLDKIFPQAIEEKCEWRKLLEIDFHWICRCLRLLNYGPYHTTNTIFCSNCGTQSAGEYQVDLRTVNVKVLPDKFINKIKIDKSEFMDFGGDITLHLMTIQEVMNAQKDQAFHNNVTDRQNMEMARICYSIDSIAGQTNLTPVEIKLIIEKEFSSADYMILKKIVADITDYGVRAGGSCQCPKCQDPTAAFIALVDDRFFRPTLGDLRKWKDSPDRKQRGDVSGDKAKDVRKHS